MTNQDIESVRDHAIRLVMQIGLEKLGDQNQVRRDVASMKGNTERIANSRHSVKLEALRRGRNIAAWVAVAGCFAALVSAPMAASSDAGTGIITVLFLIGAAGAVGFVCYWIKRDSAKFRVQALSNQLYEQATVAYDDAVTHRQAVLLQRAEETAIEAEEALRLATLEHRASLGLPPPPEPQPFGVSHQGAEALVAAWMRHLGILDAEPTRYVSDGGIDVTGNGYIAQVKNYTGTVGVAEVRELAGVAVVDGRTALFWTSGTYAVGAVEFADRAGITLFIYDAAGGAILAANALGETAIADGFPFEVR